MANKAVAAWLIEEVAEFLASCPSPEELLAFRPSARAVQRYSALLAKSKDRSLSADEKWELDQFEHIEILMQSIKARLRPLNRCVYEGRYFRALESLTYPRSRTR